MNTVCLGLHGLCFNLKRIRCVVPSRFDDRFARLFCGGRNTRSALELYVEYFNRVQGVVSSRAFCGGTNTQEVCAEDCGGWRGLVPNFQDFSFPWVIRDRPSPPSASSPSSLYSLYTLFILSFIVSNSK